MLGKDVTRVFEYSFPWFQKRLRRMRLLSDDLAASFESTFVTIAGEERSRYLCC